MRNSGRDLAFCHMYMSIYACTVHVLMRDEKEGRKKQARPNNQQGKATQHTQDSHFPNKNELAWVGLEPTTLYTLDSDSTTELPRQLSWLGTNLTSHSTPDEQRTRTVLQK